MHNQHSEHLMWKKTVYTSSFIRILTVELLLPPNCGELEHLQSQFLPDNEARVKSLRAVIPLTLHCIAISSDRHH